MKTYKKAGVATGIFYILAIVAGIIGMMFEGALGEENFLSAVASSQGQTLTSVLFVMLMGISVCGIAFSAYPVIKKYNQGIAAGYLGARIIEGVLHFIGAISILLVITLSRQFAAAGSPDMAYFNSAGELLKSARDWAYVVMDVAVFSIGAVIFYSLMHKHRLIPRGITVWGIIAAVIYFGAGIASMMGLADPSSIVIVFLNIPLALQELTMAIYLIAKGFRPSVVPEQQLL